MVVLLTRSHPLGPRNAGWLRRSLPVVWMAMAPLGSFAGGWSGAAARAIARWGGLSLTVLLTIGSGLLALPFGVMLAIGQYAAACRCCVCQCTAYIETMRAVPLIAVLFFGQLLIPLFLPPGLEINRVLRAVIAFAVFAAAYIAEDVRGGLQAIPQPRGGGIAVLGLSPRQSIQLVVLPQAPRVMLCPPSLTIRRLVCCRTPV